jgi:hypothetical protein
MGWNPHRHYDKPARRRALLRRRNSAIVELFEVADISFDPRFGPIETSPA